eukprot:s3318_g1.t1
MSQSSCFDIDFGACLTCPYAQNEMNFDRWGVLGSRLQLPDVLQDLTMRLFRSCLQCNFQRRRRWLNLSHVHYEDSLAAGINPSTASFASDFRLRGCSHSSLEVKEFDRLIFSLQIAVVTASFKHAQAQGFQPRVSNLQLEGDFGKSAR